MQGNQEDKTADILNIPCEIWFMPSQLTVLENVRDPVRGGLAIKYSDAWFSMHHEIHFCLEKNS